MMNPTGLRRIPPDQSSGSGHSFGSRRHPSIKDPILSKRVCFYKSGDPQFNGLRMVINNRTFKTFDALLDSLSKKVPLPFGVRNITTPRGVHAIYNLDELEDGKSYICSDSRKVKPINLALARKKLPPWYHARPVSSRRRTVQQARFFPGQNIHKQERVVVRTPKKLLVFRNGDPTVKYTVVLHKRTTPTFESILEYISELMQFHVVKLHTPDGRRVDSLPGLILCSGTVVAGGREPFRSANYNVQKSLTPTWLPTNRKGPRRLKSLNRKKKSMSYSSKSRNFSPSSEQYIVNRIHNSIAESSYDLPSNPTNSVELESSRILESVAETEGDGAEGQGCLLPAEDDIEKSFRVNQDGSMTVEMKVRLTIKEEETIHWTTTLTRSSVANQCNASCLTEREAEQEICSSTSNSLDPQSPADSTDSINKDRTKDNNDEDPPSLSNGAPSESGNEEDYIKVQTDVLSPRRAPTPGYKQIRKKQPSMESIKSLMGEGIQEGMVGSYSYKEQTENGAMTEQYCMVKQTTTKPVPKPRRFGSVDANNISSQNVSTFKSAAMSEILQIESSGEEVTETVLHIYEQQTCQDNFFANICAQGMSATGISFARPATSETGQLSSNNEFEPEHWRPSTASESISIWRAENMSITSDLTLPSLETDAIQATTRQQQFSKSTRSKDKPQQREVNKAKRVYSKTKVINKHIRRLLTPGKRQKDNSAEASETRKKVKTFSSAGFIKRIYGNKSKSAKNTMKLKKGPAEKVASSFKTNTSQLSDDTTICIVKDANIPSSLTENSSETVSSETGRLNVSSTEVSQSREILTRQTSMHQDKKNENKSYDISKSMALPAFHSSSSVINEYVENWLEKAQLNHTSYPDEGGKKAVILLQTENRSCGGSEYNGGMINVAEDRKCQENKSDIQRCQTLKSDPLQESLLGSSVKLRIQSFENKSSSSSAEKTTVTQQGDIAHSHDTTTNTENCTSVAQNNTEEIKPLLNGNRSEMNPVTKKTSTEMPSGIIMENKSSPIKISLQKATLSKTISMELPPPPPPAEITEHSSTEYFVTDVPSAASSPSYRLSSTSSQMSDDHPLSISPKSDKNISPTDHAMETTTSVQSDIPSMPREEPLTRCPSIKRAPLVSNLSLERKMSLRKACLDKYTLCTDASSDTSSSSTPINTVGDDDKMLPNAICSTGTQLPPEKTQQSNSSPSVSPTSVTSGDRISSASISSSDAPTSCDIPFKETKTNKTQFLTQKEASSPKSLAKEVKQISSPSPERKPQTKKLSSEFANDSPKLSSLHNHHSDKSMSPNIGIREPATPIAGPPTERKKMQYKPNLQKRPSPYSQSLDMVSPPVRHKSSRKMLSRNLSSDNVSESGSVTHRKTSSERKRRQTSQSIKSTAELNKMLEASQIAKNEAKKTNDLTNTDQSVTETQLMPQPLNVANQPNMKPVLEKICYSIKSIRQITRNKHRSCLEKSNSLPDFSSHVASTFGSSSKALLAFLSVMTLKEGITNFNMDELNANNVSCAEALKMIDSLREIASIEDSHKLKVSLSNLQQSTSKQLLQSWKDFQELSNKCKSRSSTPNCSEEELITEASPEKDCGTEENVIDEIMDNLDIPEKLKVELASISMGVKTESDDEEKMSARFIGKVELSPKDNSDSEVSHSSTEDAVNVRNVTQDEKFNVDVSSIIKKFTNINQQKQSDMDSSHLITERVKHEPNDQTTTDEDGQYGQNGVVKCPPAEPVEEDGEAMNSCEEENLENQETLNMNRVVSSEKHLEKESHEVECRQLQMQSEESVSVPENELTSDEEEQPEVECEEIKQEGSEGEDLSNPDSDSEEEEDKQPSSNYYVELSVSRKESISSPDRENQSLTEEEQPEVECRDLSNKDTFSYPTSLPESEKVPNIQISGMGLNISVDESTGNSDEDEKSSSEEEQAEAECKELKVIIEESLSETEEEKEIIEEEEHLDDLSDHEEETRKALIEETKENNVSSANEDPHADKKHIFGTKDLSNQDSYTEKDNSSLIKSDSLAKRCRFNADEDSGNDHSSCEGQVEVEQIKSSVEEELSYYEKESSSEEQANMDRYTEESCNEYEEAPAQSGVTIAERVGLLEKQAADAQKRENVTDIPAIRRSSEINTHLESDAEDSPSESPTSQSTICPPSAPQSSLSFSYDSSGVITTEPEGNRVKSIREMFLAKSATDIQHGLRRFPNPNKSELRELRAETSASGGYQSQTSSELSSGEDDSARKSITKGFVRRAIERLYGKKDDNPDEDASERPPSAPKQNKKEHSSIFSPFHIAHCKAVSELSYFNSNIALETLSEATRCIAFNAQVGPGDSVPIDNGRWLLRENTLIRKSVSDPVGINKAFTNSPLGEGTCEDTEQNTTYSLFTTKSEVEDKTNSLTRKCTYFSLPHASDSDVCQDDLSTVSKSSANGDSVTDTKDNSEDTKTWVERNGMLPAVVTDFKMMDNKVHPLIEVPSDGGVVVVQPGKGQGVMNRRLQEPDVLDFLYNFCGEHCPIL
uniref:Oxygen-regulated protein 1-like n=2 Tax=Seriola lalandi dorsalis TaxID=1841481 RepID=A0A3B4Z6A9_SERLL